MAEFSERVAIVTGGSRGIGRAIALELGTSGATVIVNYNRSADAAEDVVKAIKDAGGDGAAVQADVSDPEAAESLIKYAKDNYSKVDILVNNAGTTRDNLIARMKVDDFDAVLNTNLRSAWVMSKAASRLMMRARYGRIINITSVSGIAGQAGQTNYSASKAGLIGLTKSLAREVATRGVTVNAVAPGFIETDMTADLPEDVTTELDKAIPLGRWGKTEDIAYAVAFLASERSGYITGTVLSVDGGLVMG
ncbi:MAG: 3-oxoacyl-[acyl-carrier-protein] reductase [Chloroflexota bacterium]